jgi:hypothetical protein
MHNNNTDHTYATSVINGQAESHTLDSASLPSWRRGIRHVWEIIREVSPTCNRGIAPHTAIPAYLSARPSGKRRGAWCTPGVARQACVRAAVLQTLKAGEQGALVVGNRRVAHHVSEVGEPVCDAVRLRATTLPEPQPCLPTVARLREVERAVRTRLLRPRQEPQHQYLTDAPASAADVASAWQHHRASRRVLLLHAIGQPPAAS